MSGASLIHRALTAIYPDRCMTCGALVDRGDGLCGSCWSSVAFIAGLVCDLCGAPLPGDDDSAVCEDCHGRPRPWAQGRAAILYDGGGRRVVLGLKHGDRTDLARPAARWMLRAGRPILATRPLLVPVPVHWSRLAARRYNQAAELARELAREGGFETVPDALIRTRRTAVQDGLGIDARFANLADAIAVRPCRRPHVAGADICLIDDVMTSGATMTAAARALAQAGALRITALVLARVVKAP